MIVDLFAGPGGWDVAARRLGIDPIGYELDPYAVATRDANGLRTVVADLATHRPRADIAGLIASPPCPTFSAAGNREGVEHLSGLIEFALGRGPLPDGCPKDSALSAVPFYWLAHAAGSVQWFAMEQVPAVLPLWEAAASHFAGRGWSTWAGVLNAADYGVPQTRRRAILIGSLAREVRRPAASHAKGGAGGLLPWVSMGEALAAAGLWSSPQGPSLNTGRDWVTGGTRADAQTVPPTAPSPTISGKAVGQFQWSYGFPRLDDCGDSPDGYRVRDCYPADGPAPAVTEKARSVEWRLRAGNQQAAAVRSSDEPSPTVAFGHALADWVWERPATTVTGDSRIWPPGHKVNADDVKRLGLTEAHARYGDRAGTNAVRVTPEEAAVLQGFPPSHTFVASLGVSGQMSFDGIDSPLGALTHRAKQIGNAVPPGLAEAVLRAVL